MEMIREVDVLDRGILSIHQLFKDRFIFEDTFFNPKESKAHDGEIYINGEKFYFEVIIRPSISKLNKHLSNKNIERAGCLLVFDFASEEVSEYCIENKLNYLDSAGNAYINSKSIVVYIEGRQNNKYKEFTKRIFQKTGLKLIFEILRNPELLNESYRTIAEYVGISTASVGNLIEELEANRFLIDIGGKKKLNNIEKLILKWVFNYTEVLKPKLHRGFFKLISENSLEKIIENSRHDKLYFSGEYGAFFINKNKYIKPNNLIIYTKARLSLLAKNYRLVPVNNPHPSDVKIEIIEPFWNTDIITNHNVDTFNINIPPLIANDILIYADLLDSKDSRNIEVAEEIYKHEIRDRFLKSII